LAKREKKIVGIIIPNSKTKFADRITEELNYSRAEAVATVRTPCENNQARMRSKMKGRKELTSSQVQKGVNRALSLIRAEPRGKLLSLVEIMKKRDWYEIGGGYWAHPKRDRRYTLGEMLSEETGRNFS
jgi:hypothetical protein